MKCGGGKVSHPLLAAPANRRDISVPRDAAHLGEILLMIDRRIREEKALADVVTTSSNRPSLERYTLAGEVTGEKAKRTRYGELGICCPTRVKIAALAPFRRASAEVWISACAFSVVKSKPVIFNLSVSAG